MAVSMLMEELGILMKSRGPLIMILLLNLLVIRLPIAGN
jgi:hypothetical protein